MKLCALIRAFTVYPNKLGNDKKYAEPDHCSCREEARDDGIGVTPLEARHCYPVGASASAD